MTYPKIDSLYKRDQRGAMLFGEFSRPEFEVLKDVEWEWVEKVDGMNARLIVADGQVRIGGRTDNAQIPATLLSALDDILDQKMRVKLVEGFPDGAVLYGEGYGGKIQRGGGRYGETDFVMFDVRVGPWWLERAAVEEIGIRYCLGVVPIVGRGTLSDLHARVQGGVESAWGDFLAEGLVARPPCGLLDRSGRRIITKLKAKDFGVTP